MHNISTFCTVVILCFITLARASAQSADPEAVRKSTVYIFFDVTDPNTGAKEEVQGTGFVVSSRGHILTASHLFRKWRNQRDVDKNHNPIKGNLRDKPGFTSESPLVLNRISLGDPDSEDVALLKLPESGAPSYATAPICFKFASGATAGDQLMAYGFPQNQSFQPVPATLGTPNAEGGRWAAASAFTYGMSGGPVYKGGFVVGLVKGGLENTSAVNWITPIGHAENLLRIAGVVEQCEVGNAIVMDGNKNYEQSGFSFARNQTLAWNSPDADILVATADRTGDDLAQFFLPYDAPPYNGPQDAGAQSGIRQVNSDVTTCPTSDYQIHWVETRQDSIYCVRTRSGDRYTKIKVQGVYRDRIAFGWTLLR